VLTGAYVDPGYYRISSSKLDHSDFEYSYCGSIFGSGSGVVALSFASYICNDFDVGPNLLDSFGGVLSPIIATVYFTTWVATSDTGSKLRSMDLNHHYMQPENNNAAFISIRLFNRGLFKSNFGIIKPYILLYINAEVIMRMGDPMIYSDYNI